MNRFNIGDTVYCVPSGKMAIIDKFEVQPLEVSLSDPAGVNAKHVYQIAWIYSNGETRFRMGYPTSELTKTKLGLYVRRIKARFKSAWYGFNNPQFRMS